MKRGCRLLFLLILFYAVIAQTVRKLESASLIGGKPTDLHEIKYLVSLQSDNDHFCGGSIIGDWHILTAAHCIIGEDNEFDNTSVTVVAGINDLQAVNEAIITEIEKAYVPSKYNNSDYTLADIAVLKLKKSLDLKNNDNLKKLYLPRSIKHHKSHYKSYEGHDSLIAGFGWDKIKVKRKNKTEYEVGSSTDLLLRAKAVVISNDECQQYYDSPIPNSALCAKVTQHDDKTPQGICRGDSGSPLVYKSSTIIGVVSGIAIGCNENDQPGIYSRVSSYIQFVKNAIKDDTTEMRFKEY